MNRYMWGIGIGAVILLLLAIAMLLPRVKQEAVENTTSTPTSAVTTPGPVEKTTPSIQPQAKILEPVAEFKQRVTKKFFGTYITPQNSPVQPEKFTGYHTGVDVEYEDVQAEVLVRAVADGEVLLARFASGYGGLVVIQHSIGGQELVAVYGHIQPASLPKVGQKVNAGQQIGILGKGGTSETDGERKHLHFGLVQGSTVNIKGYVSSKSELTTWIDPLTVF